MIPSPDSAPRPSWLLPAGVLLVFALSFLLEDAVDHWVVTHRIAALESAARLCSRFLAWHWLMLGAGAAFLLARLRQRGDWMRTLCVMIVAASLAGLSADVLRGLTGRTRPSAAIEQGWYGVRSNSQWLVFQHAYNSFPSGHTSTAAGFALPLFFWRRRFGLVAFPFICAVALARVYVGAHHISDVVAGAIVGSVIAAWIWRRFDAGERILNALPWRARE